MCPAVSNELLVQIGVQTKVMVLDYIVIISGTIDLIFNDDSSKTLNAGDLVIQVGGIHTWHNKSSETCRESAQRSISYSTP